MKICFVNDGSTDKTAEMIQELKKIFPTKVFLISLKKNQGKAIAVFTGFNFIIKNHDCEKIAYLDADLATSLEECNRISKYLTGKIHMAFGSRILKLDNNIQRKWYRFFIGRIIATLISKILKTSIYDSQCGCKVFNKKLASKVFNKQFISKWLFDVEIFFRLIKIYGNNEIKNYIKEIPLNEWIDTPDSRVSPWYFFKLWTDLYKISKKYKN